MRKITKLLRFVWRLALSALVFAVCGLVFRSAYQHFYRAAYPIHYQQTVLEQSKAHNLPPELVFAVIRTESGFRPEVQSSVSATGLMQITPDTFEWAQYRMSEDRDLAHADLYDPEINIQYGSAILRLLLDEFGTIENALCAYHAGWGNVKKWLKNPEYSSDGVHIETIPFGDTRAYVSRVMETKEIYQKLYQFSE